MTPFLKVTGFAGSDGAFSHVSIRPAAVEGEVLVVGGCQTHAVEVSCTGSVTAEFLLPLRALQQALRRLPGQHATVVLGEDGLATLRLYEESATLAVSMPLADGPGIRLPDVDAEDNTGIAMSGRVLANASTRLKGFGALRVEPFATGWILRGRCGDLTARALIAGVRA